MNEAPISRNTSVKVVANFFEDYSLKEIKKFFDEVSETCLTTNNHIFSSAEKSKLHPATQTYRRVN